MKKSLSLVVALAMVFSLLVPAMAFAATSQETAAGNQLKELGILTGNEQGDLLLDQELTRQDMIVLLSRLLNVEEEAASHENTHGWPDVTRPFYDGYISWAKENGLTNGVGDGSTFGFDQPLTVHQLLTFLLRALGYTDVAYFDVPAKAKELGLVAANVDVNAVATRGTMAVATLATLHTEVNGEGVTLGAKLGLPGFVDEVAIASFKAVARDTLEVTFNTAVDKAKASISLKKGTNTVSVAEIDWNDANTVASIKLASKLFEGTYEVTVSGLSDEALTASVTVEDEKVASIEILGDVAPIKKGSDGQVVQIRYEVKNQYGQVANDVFDVQPNVSVGTPNKAQPGLIEVDKGTTTSGDPIKFALNEYVVVTLISMGQTQAVSTTKTLQVGLEPVVTEVAVVDLYNADDKTLNEASDPTQFYVVVEAKDQYGIEITDDTVLSDEVMVNFSGLSNLTLEGYHDRKATFSKLTIDGQSKTVLQLKKVDTKADLKEGDSILLLVAPNGGKSVNYTVKVAAATKVDTIDLQTPNGIVAEAETVSVPVFAYDRDGNLITDTDVIKKVELKFSDDSIENYTFEKEGDNVVLKFETPDNEKPDLAYGALSITAITSSYKVEVLTLSIREKATPRVVTGLKSDVNKLIFQGDDLEITKKNIIVEDNYGRQMDEDALTKAFDDGYSIIVTSPSTTDTGAVTVTAATYELNNAKTITLHGNSQGQKAVTLQIAKGQNDKVNGSQYSVTLRTVVLSEIEKIEIDEIAAVYAGVKELEKYAREVKVSGFTKDGQKVTVPSTEYEVIPLSSNLKLYDTTKNIVAADDLDKDAKAVVRVVLPNGKSAEREVTLSAEAPKVASIKIGNGDAEQTVTAGTVVDFNALVQEIKDQYGAEATVASKKFANSAGLPPISVTFSDFEDGTTVSNNGKDNAQITLANGKSAVVTIKIGDVTATAKITGKITGK